MVSSFGIVKGNPTLSAKSNKELSGFVTHRLLALVGRGDDHPAVCGGRYAVGLCAVALGRRELNRAVQICHSLTVHTKLTTYECVVP